MFSSIIIIIDLFHKLNSNRVTITIPNEMCGISHLGGARGVMVIVLGNGHGNTSSNPGREWLYFT